MPRETKRPQQPDSEELPELTPKQLGFVQGRLKNLSAADAVRAATDTTDWSDNAIWVEACKLKAHPKVRLWLSEARKQGMASTVVTLETHTAELESLKQEAREAGAYGASIKAEELKGRANGLYVDQIKTDDGKVEVLQALKTIAQAQPDLASSLAALLGVSERDLGQDAKPTHPAQPDVSH